MEVSPAILAVQVDNNVRITISHKSHFYFIGTFSIISLTYVCVSNKHIPIQTLSVFSWTNHFGRLQDTNFSATVVKLNQYLQFMQNVLKLLL